MPPAKTHEEFRKIVCLTCVKKCQPRSILNITGKVLQRLKDVQGYRNYNSIDDRYPTVICSACNQTIVRKKNEAHLHLPEPFDFTKIQLSKITRSSKTCDCTICKVGRSGFGIRTNIRPKPVVVLDTTVLPSRQNITICQRCYTVIGKGINHPSNCGLFEFRKNVNVLLKSDPIGFEYAAGALIKEKSERDTSSPNIVIASPNGKGVTLPKPISKKSYVSRALFSNSQVTIAQWAKMISAAHLNGHQSIVIAAFHRMWHGRYSIESNLKDNIHLRSHVLEDYYSTQTCLLDSHDKNERKNGLSKRVVVYNNDLLATNTYISNQRNYQSFKDTYLRINADGGTGFLKVSGNIQSLSDNDNIKESDGIKKWSYKLGPQHGKFLDSGVKRTTMYGKLSIKNSD